LSRRADIDLVLDLFSLSLADSQSSASSPQPIGWSRSTPENIVAISSTLHVLPAMHRGMKRALESCSNIKDSTATSELCSFLEQMAINNKERNQEIFRAMERTASVLERERIAPVWLKGAAHLIDGGEFIQETRFLGDIDLLVANSELAATIIALENADFRKLHDHIDQEQEQDKHYPMLIHDDIIVGLEVHRRIFPNHDDPLIHRVDIAGTAKTVSRNRRSWLLPSLSNRLFHLIHHSMVQNSFFDRHLISLRDQLDFHNLFKNGLEQQTVREVGKLFVDSGYRAHFAAFAEFACRVQPADALTRTGIGEFAGDGRWLGKSLTRLAHPNLIWLIAIGWLLRYYYQRWRMGTPILSRRTLVLARNAIAWHRRIRRNIK
jgi:hypothetical protein